MDEKGQNFSGASQDKPYTYEDVEEIANFLRSKVDIKPRIGVICGTGLGAVTSLVTQPITIPYTDIPNFPASTVQGHAGQLLFGYIGPIPVVCMKGRFHFYEGFPLWKVVLPVRVMKLLGVSILVGSNAAGGINSSYKLGDIMLIKDHINFLNFGGHNPLQGPNEEKFGGRFVAMNDAYDRQLLEIAKDAAQEMGAVKVGVYAGVGGPCFETIAEMKALKMLGADAVGMSTVHEVITARHCGIRCFAFSLITDVCSLDYEGEEKPDHEEILIIGEQKQHEVMKFVDKVFQRFAELLL